MIYMIGLMSLFVFILSGVVMGFVVMLSQSGWGMREKMSPFECGFDPSSSSRLPFSLHFFLIAVLFLIFDIEVALLLPLVLTLFWVKYVAWVFMGVVFVMILLLGLYYEWVQGALCWAK